jgi:hypothetical protein
MAPTETSATALAAALSHVEGVTDAARARELYRCVVPRSRGIR